MPVSVEYSVMKRLSLRLISSSSALAIAVVLVALSFACVRASAVEAEVVKVAEVAEVAEAAPCSFQANVMDQSVEAAEELDVLCQAFWASTQGLGAEVPAQTPMAADDLATAVDEMASQSPDEPTSSAAIEGKAISVEIVETVTIAGVGQDTEQNEEHEETSSIAPAAAPDAIIALEGEAKIAPEVESVPESAE
jgi:hypothetical protein